METTNILKILSDHCNKKATGTFLVVTKDNQACNIVLKKGLPLSAKFGDLVGVEVLNALSTIEPNKISFLNNLQVPMSDDCDLHDAEAIVTSLFANIDSIDQPVSSQQTNEPSPPQKKKQKQKVGLYRGQPIYEEVTIEEELNAKEDIEPESKPEQKKQRYYRGQLINDNE